MMKVVIILLTYFSFVVGDCYMQNPRGSNDRLNEQNTDRNNADRLFNSQNNGQGGYCWHPTMYYYVGSLLTIEWTNQHSCGNGKTTCQIILQYYCQPNSQTDPTLAIRDGAITTPTDNTNQITPATVANVTTDIYGNIVFQYGMHEPLSDFTACNTRNRNAGLFIADRNLGSNAQNTRQDNNGETHGFECQEERDYYPYWHPSAWRDIAILTDDTARCSYYQAQSQNVLAKNYCVLNGGAPAQYNNEVSCTGNGGTWTSTPSFGLAPPDCIETYYNKDNSLSNGVGRALQPSGVPNMYNWTIPYVGSEDYRCVLRIRYNLTSSDTNNSGVASFWDLNSSFNAGNSPVYDDPTITTEGYNFTLAIDTSQFGRTFQDRSHTFLIRNRPSNIPALARVFNLNVKGKRGNIVQTYPATEYDFHPKELNVLVGDYVHFQWSGCDTNPNGNAGEGQEQTDRYNIAQLYNNNPGASKFENRESWFNNPLNPVLFPLKSDRTKFAWLNQSPCKTYAELEDDDTNNGIDPTQNEANCYLLNSPSAQYFDGGAYMVQNAGTFYYMSTRNNNFSNRDQKGTLTVSRVLPTWGIALVSVGGATFAVAMGTGAAAMYAQTHPTSALGQKYMMLSSKV